MKELTAKDLMNPEVLMVRDELAVADLAELLVEQEISGVPVVDADDNVVGVVSVTDIARSASRQGGVTSARSDPDFYLRGWEEEYNAEDLAGLQVESGGMAVREIMTPTVQGVSEDTPVTEIARRLIDTHYHRLLVLREGRPVGIVTSTDLLRLIAEVD